MQTCDRFVQREYFIQFEKNDSSRYYAAFLWNFKLLCEAEENEVIYDSFDFYKNLNQKLVFRAPINI